MKPQCLWWWLLGLFVMIACGDSAASEVAPSGAAGATAGRAASLEAPLTDIASLTIRGGYILAVRHDGKVMGWGACAPPFSRSIQQISSLGEVTSLTAVADISPDNSCAICSAVVCAVGKDGRLRCDAFAHTLREEPELAKLTSKIISAGVGRHNACVVVEDGAVHCWGASEKLREVSGIPARAEELVVGFDHACARLLDGTVWCWGDNSKAQLGVGKPSTRGQVTQGSAMAMQAVGVSSVTRLSVSGDTTCGVLSDGGVMCWGGDEGGADGQPHRIEGLERVVQYLPAAAGCGLLADGQAACRKTFDGEWSKLRGVENAVSLAIGTTSCFAARDGTVKCWGTNTSGGHCTSESLTAVWNEPMPIRCNISRVQ